MKNEQEELIEINTERLSILNKLKNNWVEINNLNVDDKVHIKFGDNEVRNSKILGFKLAIRNEKQGFWSRLTSEYFEKNKTQNYQLVICCDSGSYNDDCQFELIK